jgi:hypothetical protein
MNLRPLNCNIEKEPAFSALQYRRLRVACQAVKACHCDAAENVFLSNSFVGKDYANEQHEGACVIQTVIPVLFS